MNQQKFVKHFVSSSEHTAEAKESLERAKGEYEINSSLYRTSLSLSPYYQSENTSYEGSTTEIDSNGLYVEAELNQSSGIGLSADLEYREFFNNNKPAKSFGLTFSLPVFKNALGYADRRVAMAAEAQLKNAHLTYRQQFLRACGAGHLLYVRAWTRSEEHKILSESLTLAEKAMRTTRVNYQRRLIRKIDFESAQADFLRLQDETKLAAIAMKSAVDELKAFWPAKGINFELSSPLPVLDKLKIGGLDLEPIDVKKSALQKDAAVFLAQAERSNSLTDLSLTAGVGQTEVTTPALAPLDERTDQWYRIGISTEWPMWDSTKSGARKAAIASSTKAQLEHARLAKTLPVSLAETQSTFVNLQAALIRHQERLRLRQSQIKEAQRLLSIGKIEFEDYIRYRDLELREKLQGTRIGLEGWQEFLKLAEATGNDFGVCDYQERDP